MSSLHEDANDRITVQHYNGPIEAMGPEIASLLRRASIGHIYDEHVVPLHQNGGLVAALATRAMTWPSAGSRPVEAEALAMAAVGAGKRALLAPVFTLPQHTLNLGLISATQRSLLVALAEQGSEEVAVLVREGSVVVQTALASVGFEPSGVVAVTDHALYVAHVVSPRALLDALGVAETRQGDLLSLRVERDVLARLTSFHLVLEAAARPYLAGRPEWAEILPGLAGWGNYPIDAGINTPSTGPRLNIEDISVEIIQST